MSELILVGRNSTTNKKAVLNITDDGELKIDETNKITDIDNKLTSIETDIETTNNKLQTLQDKVDDMADNLKNFFSYNMYNDIRYLRGNLSGRAYMLSIFFYSTADTLKIASIYNPDSNQQLYVYKIDYQIDNDNTGDVKTSLRLLRHEGHTGGTTQVAKNLKINSGNYSGNVEFKKELTSYTNESSLCYLTFGDAPGAYKDTLDLKDDMIEISSGNGIGVDYNLTTNSTTNNCRGYLTFFFIEKSLTQKLPTEYIPV